MFTVEAAIWKWMLLIADEIGRDDAEGVNQLLLLIILTAFNHRSKQWT